MAMQETHHHVIPWEVGLERVEERRGSQLLGDPRVAIHIHNSAVKVEDDHGAIAIAIMLPHTALSSFFIHPSCKTHKTNRKSNNQR